MSGKFKKTVWWVRRRSHLPMLIIAGVIVMLLLFNEDTSVELNVKYQKEINELRREIKSNLDSAEYYRTRRMAIERGESDLEHIAREQYHMQRLTEDVFLLK